MKARLESIDVWRGLAALAVVAMHVRHNAPGGFKEHPFFILWILFEYGYLGVSLFDVGPFHLGSWCHWPFFYTLHWTLGAMAVDASAGNIRLPNWCASLRWSAWFAIPGILLNPVVVEVLSGFLFALPGAYSGSGHIREGISSTANAVRLGHQNGRLLAGNTCCRGCFLSNC